MWKIFIKRTSNTEDSKIKETTHQEHVLYFHLDYIIFMTTIY